MPTTSNNTELDSEELLRAVHAVSAALVELRADPAADSVRHRIDAAEQALAPLGRDLTMIVLRRLLDSIENCHRAGQPDSGSLADRERSTVRALRLDPRWKPSPARLKNVS
jgi:hypothetical protein